jgi:TfoX/Sxy family transcriptional regulator of competence genes
VAYDEELAARVRAVLPRGEAVTERRMFGGLAFMLGGHMFCGVIMDTLMVRLGRRPPTAPWASRTCGR